MFIILIATALIVLACFIAYSTSFGNVFVFDDISQIVNNDAIKSLRNIPEVFTRHLTFFTKNNKEEGKFYRPVQSITLMIDHLLWGLEPFGYHLTNTLLHATVSVLIFWFLLPVTKNIAVSFITSILYTVHPLHTEAVTYISGRADSLCAIFLFIMIMLKRSYVSSSSKSRKALYYILILACFILSLLSKEYAVIFPFLMLWCDYCLGRENGYDACINRKLLFYIPLFIIMGVWFFIKNGIVATETMVEEPASFATRLATMPRLIYDYVRLSLFLAGLHMGYKLQFPRSLLQQGYFGPFVFACLFACLLFYTWLRGKTDVNYKTIVFGLGWFSIGLVPYLNILFQLNAPFAEHWVYISEIGLILSAVYFVYTLIKDIPWMKKAAVSVSIIFFIFFTYKTTVQNLVWKDSITFYAYTAKYAPFSETVYNNLAVEYIKLQDWKKAEQALKRALEINPDYEVARENLQKMEGDMKQRGIK